MQLIWFFSRCFFLTAVTLAWKELSFKPRRSNWAYPICNIQNPNNRKLFHTKNNLWRSHTHTHPFNGAVSGTTRVSWYQKGNTNLDFTEARDSEWQWHQLGRMQVCTSLKTDNHASTPLLSFLQAGCPSCRPTNSVKALTASSKHWRHRQSTEGIYADHMSGRRR